MSDDEVNTNSSNTPEPEKETESASTPTQTSTSTTNGIPMKQLNSKKGYPNKSAHRMGKKKKR